MANDSQEFETKPSSNKDLWLFLIVLDVVFLCVFGFFLYKHFSGRVLNNPSLHRRTCGGEPCPARSFSTDKNT